MTDQKFFDGWLMHHVATYTDKSNAIIKAIQLRRTKHLARVVPYGGRWRVYSTPHVITHQKRHLKGD